RLNDAGRDKDHQVTLQVLFDARAEESPNQRDIAETRDLVLDLLNVLTNEAAENDRVAVIDRHAGLHLAGGEDRLVDDVWCDDVSHRLAEQVRGGRLNRAAVV